MKIGLLLNSNNKLCLYCERYKEILACNNIPFVLIDPNSIALDEDIKGCTHLLFRHSQGDTDIKIYEAIFNIAANIHGIECYPDYNTFWSYEDKIKEYYLMRSNDLPMIESYVFWNLIPAANFLKTVSYPLVAKLPKGAGSCNVVLVKSPGDGERIINQVFRGGVKNGRMKSSSNLHSIRKAGIYRFGKGLLKSFLINTGIIIDKSDFPEWQLQKDAIIFQKFLPGNSHDTRVTVIGKRAFAFRRFVRNNDFRASGSGKIDNNPAKIDIRCIESAFKVSGKLKFNTMAYDFIYDEKQKPFINELSYCFMDKAIENCNGYWDDNLNWHNGRNWPQYYQLSDFLKKDDLKKSDNHI